MVKRKEKELVVVGREIGGECVRTMCFGANRKGQFWPLNFKKIDVEEVATPANVCARTFGAEIRRSLIKKNQLHPDADLLGVSVSGLVKSEERTCVRSVSLGISEPFIIEEDAVMNAGFAGLIGSMIAGEANEWDNAIQYYSLGTSLDMAGLIWGKNDLLEDQLVFADTGAHFDVSGSERYCDCGRTGCAAAMVNEQALKDLFHEAGITPHKLKDPARKQPDIAHDLAYQIALGDSKYQEEIGIVLRDWQERLAGIIAHGMDSETMGGDEEHPGLFVLGGKLARFADEIRVVQMALSLRGGSPQKGNNFIVRLETALENNAGCVGAAVVALAGYLTVPVHQIDFLPKAPK